jgi:hypothetical protein
VNKNGQSLLGNLSILGKPDLEFSDTQTDECLDEITLRIEEKIGL